MTILWIYNQPLVPEAGGTERITSLVAKGLSARGHNCLGILVFNDKDGSMTYDGKTVTDLYAFLKERGVDIVINQIAYAKWLLEAFLTNGGDRWRAEGGRIISCLHFDPCNPSELHMLNTKAHWILRDYINYVKLIVFHSYYKYRQQKSEGDVYNYIYDNSESFITLSSSHFDYMSRVMRRDRYDKLHAIGNPLTFEANMSATEFDNKKNTLLVCARMSEYHKRISIILKTWHLLQNKGIANYWTLKLIGDGPDLQRYKTYAERKHLKNIEFLGRQNPEPFYLEAKILLLTSSAEGWGLTITEALQYGLVPVVMNSSSVYDEIITHQYDGILCPNNKIMAFATAIYQLINDTRRLDSMQRNALQSSKKFVLSKAIDKWEEIINPR